MLIYTNADGTYKALEPVAITITGTTTVIDPSTKHDTLTVINTSGTYSSVIRDVTITSIVSASVTTTTVPIAITITGVQASEIEGYALSFNPATPSSFVSDVPTEFIIAASGQYVVYVWVKLVTGEIFSTSSVFVATLPDTTVPTITLFEVPETATTSPISVNLQVADDIGVKWYYVGHTVPTKDSQFSLIKPTSVVVVNGSNTIYAAVMDAAGNMSAVASDTCVVTIQDTELPYWGSFTAPDYTTSLTFDISLVLFEADYWIIKYTTTKPVYTDPDWQAYITPSISFTSERAGAVQLYAWGMDAAGNITGVSQFQYVQIDVEDTTPPTVTAFTIPATQKNSSVIPISTFTAEDDIGVAAYLISTSSATPSVNDSRWSATPPQAYAAPDYGTYTLYAFAKDYSDNVSTGVSDTIELTCDFNFSGGFNFIEDSSTLTSLQGEVATITSDIGFTSELAAMFAVMEWTYRFDTILYGPTNVLINDPKTSDLLPCGYVSASSYTTGFDPYKAFDNDTGTTWKSTAASGAQWIYFQTCGDIRYALNGYTISIATAAQFPTAFKIEGSTDGTTWVSLDSRSGLTGLADNQVVAYECAVKSSNTYNYFRFWTDTSVTTNVIIKEIKFFAQQVVYQAVSDLSLDYIAIDLEADATLVSYNESTFTGEIKLISTLETGGVVTYDLDTSLYTFTLETDIILNNDQTIDLTGTFKLFDSTSTFTGFNGGAYNLDDNLNLISTNNRNPDLGGFTNLQNDFGKLVGLSATYSANSVSDFTTKITHIGSLTSDATGVITADFSTNWKSFTATLTAIAGSIDTIGFTWNSTQTYLLEGITGEVNNLEVSLYQFDLTSRAYANIIATLTATFPHLVSLVSNATLVDIAITLAEDLVKTWAINTTTKAHSTYTNYNFDSYIEEGGRILATLADGIYALEGNTDNTQKIGATLKSGVLDFGSINQKTISDAYIHARTQGSDLTLSTIVDETKITEYELIGDDKTGMRNRRVKTSLGVRGRSWQLSLQNTDGTEMEVESITVRPAILNRRI